MARSIYHKLSGVLWAGLVCALVVLALYVALGRLFVASLGAYQEAILQEINLRVPFDVEAQEVSGQWRSFTPVIVLSGLRLSFPENPESPIALTQGQAGIDVWNSLRTASLQITHLVIDGLNLRGEIAADGKFRLRGFSSGQGESGQWLQTFLLNTRLIQLRDNALRLTLPSGERREFDLNLVLTRSGSSRRAQATLTSTRGTEITVLARGVGNPFQTASFTGTAYVDAYSKDLGAMQDLFSENPPGVWAQGELQLELWASFDAGTPLVATRLEAGNLRVAPNEGDWSLPLSRVSLQAHVSQDGNRWRLDAADVEIANAEHSITLPRLQLDAWQSALRFRATQLDVSSLARFASSFEVAPQGFKQLLQALTPAGSISALQINIADYQAPLDDWELEANFDDVFVAGYNGAPGARSAAGFVALRPGGGTVILDSQYIELDFPAIYRAPLAFDDLAATLTLAWDSDRVTLDSGLISATSADVPTTALLGLDIPLQPRASGIEMDLLVGVRDAELFAVEKYLPYTLDEGLLDWVTGSLGGGYVDAGSFLWRGSLRSDASALRTVQLAFNVTDTDLSYHPDWPAVTVSEGIVLIDNAAVSVWADRGTLLDSTLTRVSVETGLDQDERVTLAIEGHVNGPAADGLQVVNNSPLSEIVGGVFNQWDISGDLQTALHINLTLGDDAPPPEVDVSTVWSNVDLTVMPGNVPLRDVNGEFDYSSAEGFASRDLVAWLWGQRAEIELRQTHASASRGYQPGSSVLEVVAQSRLAMSSLQQWLDLDLLSIASGETAVEVSIQVTPGKTPRLIAASDLRGVRLELPQPWTKAASDVAQLRLSYDLDPAGQQLKLKLDDELTLNAQLASGGFLAGGLGIGGSEPNLKAGQFVIVGAVADMNITQWSEFIDEHFANVVDGMTVASSTVLDGSAKDGTGAGSASDHSLPGKTPVLQFVVDELEIGALTVLGRSFSDVTASLELQGSDLSVSLATDWLRGDVLWSPTTGNSLIDVHLLDMDGIPEDELTAAHGAEDARPDAGEHAASAFTLPRIRVEIADIYRQGRRLGDLAFELESSIDKISLQDVSGNLAGLRFAQDDPAQLHWQRSGDVRSRFKGRIEFSDLGDTLEQLGYERIIQTREGAFDVNIDWPGPPTDFSLAGAGSLAIDVGKGSFLNAPAGAAGALRVVSILNLVHIVQSLSVSHMFDSGIPFDSVQGEMYLHDGTIEVPGISVAGGSSFQFSGVSDIASESLSGELVATLPVAKNLPWVAALAAGLPVAAGVFVVSQLFDAQVSRLSSAVYRVQGTWDEPKVSFNRIFDNTAPAGGATAPSTLPPAQDPDDQIPTAHSDVPHPEQHRDTQDAPAPPEANEDASR